MTEKGDGRRVSRVEKEVQAAIANYLIRSFRFEYGIVTVSKVILTADLRSARVYVSLMSGIGSDEEIEAAALKSKKSKSDPMDLLLNELKYEAFDIQNYIAAELKLRFIPKLQFYKDETTERVLAIEKTLHEMKKPTPGQNS
jgi:ribosome-binding factor A